MYSTKTLFGDLHRQPPDWYPVNYRLWFEFWNRTRDLFDTRLWTPSKIFSPEIRHLPFFRFLLIPFLSRSPDWYGIGKKW